jgi:hypothetical protein
MELLHSHRIDYEELGRQKLDFFIAVRGVQNRSTYLVNNLPLNSCTSKFLLKHPQSIEWFRKNDLEKILLDEGYRVIDVQPNDISKIDEIANEIIHAKINGNELNILIDYSCMPKKWYAHIINKISKSDMAIDTINLYFAYTPPAYNTTPPARNLKELKPLSIGNNLEKNTKPVALILGLGTNREMSQALIKRIQPSVVYCLFADPAYDKRFVADVLKNNKVILDTIDSDKIFKYPANNIEQIHSLLTTISLELRLKYKVVVAPVGPKTFVLSSLIHSINYPDVEIWEIETEQSGKITECEAILEPIVFKAVFKKDSDDDEY